MTFTTLTDELLTATTGKTEFLEQMEGIIPWTEWVALIRPHYYKGHEGNQPYELELMLRIYLLQSLYDLADMRVMTEVIDSRAFSQFCGVNARDEVPDGDTIGRFRNILEKHGLQEALFTQVVNMLKARGMILKKGTIVDSTIISAPTSTKNREKQRDPEAKSTKKGNTWHFGYKAHIGVDKDTGLVHSIETTPASVHDVTMTHKLLHGEEDTVHGDAGFIGADKREEAILKNKSGKKIRYRINQRPSSNRNKCGWCAGQSRRREREKASVRAKVEHVFQVVKNLFKYRKTRYRGLQKQTAKHHMIFALSNLYMANRRLATNANLDTNAITQCAMAGHVQTFL